MTTTKNATTYRHVITQEVEIPSDDLVVLLDMAGYGVSYWCTLMETDEDEQVVRVRTDEAPSVLTVIPFGTLAKVLVEMTTADMIVAEYARDYFKDLTSEDGREWAAGNFDSDLGDIVLQLAMFNEVIYG